MAVAINERRKNKSWENALRETQFAVQMGMGTDLKGQEYTKAAAAAVRDALHRNYISMHHAFNLPLEQMIVKIRDGVGNPDAVDLDVIKAEAPVGKVTAPSRRRLVL